MNSDYTTKIKLIAPYYVMAAAIALILPIIIRWLLENVVEVELLNLDVWEIWLPMLFPYVVIILVLRPKLALLKFEKTNTRSFYQFIAALSLAVPAIFIQNLYTTASYDLVRLNSVENFPEAERSRYYDLHEFGINSDKIGRYVDVRSAGSNNHDLQLKMFTAIPFAVGSDSSKTPPVYWIGILQYERINNRLSETKKEKLYEDFLASSWVELKDYDFSKINYFEKVGKSTDRDFFHEAISHALGAELVSPVVIMMPKMEVFEDRNGEKLYWAKLSFGIGSFVFLFALWFPPLCLESLANYKEGKHKVNNPFFDVLQILIPNRFLLVTPLLLNINLLVFLAMWFSGIDLIHPTGGELLEWGANRRAETTDGEWWRLITSMFLHGGVMHLLLNMYGLVIASVYVEPIFGKLKTTILYFTSGICGSLASIYWYENSISVGASGAIFGLFGAIIALLPTDIFHKEVRKPIFTMFGSYIAISLVMGLAGGIDNAAHLGGLFGGAITALIIYFVTLRNGSVR